jgi:hypothetical protein
MIEDNKELPGPFFGTRLEVVVSVDIGGERWFRHSKEKDSDLGFTMSKAPTPSDGWAPLVGLRDKADKKTVWFTGEDGVVGIIRRLAKARAIAFPSDGADRV